jgi:hypothetical protein
VNPTAVDYNVLAVYDGVTNINVTAVAINNNGADGNMCNYTVAAGGTTSRTVMLDNQSSAGYLGFSSEL